MSVVVFFLLVVLLVLSVQMMALSRENQSGNTPSQVDEENQELPIPPLSGTAELTGGSRPTGLPQQGDAPWSTMVSHNLQTFKSQLSIYQSVFSNELLCHFRYIGHSAISLVYGFEIYFRKNIYGKCNFTTVVAQISTVQCLSQTQSHRFTAMVRSS